MKGSCEIEVGGDILTPCKGFPFSPGVFSPPSRNWIRGLERFATTDRIPMIFVNRDV